jgi:hypothetical protein
MTGWVFGEQVTGGSPELAADSVQLVGYPSSINGKYAQLRTGESVPSSPSLVRWSCSARLITRALSSGSLLMRGQNAGLL